MIQATPYQLTPFAQALRARRRVLNTLKGIQVLYCTDTAEIPVSARIGKTVFRQSDFQGLDVLSRRRDFLIDCSELVDPFTGQTFEPLEGHRIKEPTGGGCWQTYEVTPAGTEPAARHSDTTASEWRIHTIRTAGDATE